MPSKKTNLYEAYKSKRGPKALVSHFFEKVSVFDAFIIVFITFLLNTLIFILLKVPNFFNLIASNVLSVFLINWLVLAVIFYLLMYFVVGLKKLPEKAFKKVLSSLAAFKLISIIYTILMAFIFIIFINSYIPVVQLALQNPSVITSSTLYPPITFFNIIGFILLFMISLAFIVYIFLMLYEFTEILFKVKSPVVKIVLTVFFIIIIGFLNFIFV